jgi:outer membrane protein, heavy metal efflux system
VGCIALLGQVVLAGVTICARIDAAREHGSEDPMVEGARDAFRPVLLTTALALLGLLPAAMSHAMGSETQRPFAIAVVAGLLVIAPAVLFILPMLYVSRRDHGPTVRAQSAGGGAETVPELTRVIAMMLAITSVTVPAYAQEQGASSASSTGTFTFEDAKTLLLRGHPRLASARSLEQAAQSDVTVAALWSNPSLSIDYVQGLKNSSYDRVGAAVASVSQLVELSGVPAARRESAEYLRAAARAEREQVERELLVRLEETFVDLVAQRRVLAITDRLLVQLRRSEQIVQSRVAAGVMSGFAARRISVARAEAEAELRVVQSEYRRMRGDFDVALGPLSAALTTDPELDLETIPPLPGAARLTARAQTERRDLAAATARSHSAFADIAVARRSVFPGISLRVIAGFGQAAGQWDLGAGVALPLPLIDRGQGSIEAASSRARSAEQSRDTLALAIQQRVTAAYDAARLRVEAFATFADSTRGADAQLVAEAEAQFREGRLTVLELVDGITTAQRITVRRLELARDARLAELQLRRLVEVGE